MKRFLSAVRNLFALLSLIAFCACAIKPNPLPTTNNVSRKSPAHAELKESAAGGNCEIEDVQVSFVQGEEAGIQVSWIAKRECQLRIQKRLAKKGATWEEGEELEANEEYYLDDKFLLSSTYKIRLSEISESGVSTLETLDVTTPSASGGFEQPTVSPSPVIPNPTPSVAPNPTVAPNPSSTPIPSPTPPVVSPVGILDVKEQELAMGPKPLGVGYEWPVAVPITNVGTGGVCVKFEFSEPAFTSAGSSTCLSGQGLAPGFGCYIKVLFTPTERNKDYRGTLKVSDCEGGNVHQVPLSGSAYPIEQDTPRIFANATDLDFRSVPMGSTSTMMVVINNYWSAPAELVFDPIPAGFYYTPDRQNTCTHLLPSNGGTCYFFLSFSPQGTGRVERSFEVKSFNRGIAGEPLLFRLIAN